MYKIVARKSERGKPLDRTRYCGVHKTILILKFNLYVVDWIQRIHNCMKRRSLRRS